MADNGDNSSQETSKKLEELCREHPDIVQEMADEGYILEPTAILTCLKNGIVFKEEFLIENGITNPAEMTGKRD